LAPIFFFAISLQYLPKKIAVAYTSKVPACGLANSKKISLSMKRSARFWQPRRGPFIEQPLSLQPSRVKFLAPLPFDVYAIDQSSLLH
jgi:hypothetical protein